VTLTILSLGHRGLEYLCKNAACILLVSDTHDINGWLQKRTKFETVLVPESPTARQKKIGKDHATFVFEDEFSLLMIILGRFNNLVQKVEPSAKKLTCELNLQPGRSQT
jgi:hypothetical protein